MLQRQQILGLALLLVAGLVLLSGAQRSEPPSRKPIETTALKLYDDAGKLRGLLTVTPKGHSGLALIQENGKIGVTVGVGKEGGASLELLHSDGKLRARVSLAEEGDAVLHFYDAEGKVTKQLP
jgi:hypothetical protein